MSKTVMTYNNTVMSFGSTPKWMGQVVATSPEKGNLIGEIYVYRHYI